MNNDRDLLKQALEALEYWVTVPDHSVILDLRERLAQKEKPDGQQTTGPLTDHTDHVRNGSDYTPEQTVRDRGAEWRPFLVEFTTQEGDFTVELWAVDWVHAQDRLEELKATARIKGEKKGVNND